jgi:K+-sensing histidine kinase KdpD
MAKRKLAIFLGLASGVGKTYAMLEEALGRLSLRDGKVYVPDQEIEDFKNFYRSGNINALRELALRYPAQRMDRQLESYRRVRGIDGLGPTGEKILVCISASPFSAQLIRIAKRMTEKIQWPRIFDWQRNRGLKSSV